MTDNFFCSSAPNPMSTTMKIIHFERINFDNSVEIKSTYLQEVPWCQKKFYTDKELSLCTVNINIPYVGNIHDQDWTQSKIVLYLDEEPIYTGMINSHTMNRLSPLFISGDKTYLKPGNHTISLKACVIKGGNLNIPHFNRDCLELIEPKIFASIKILGFY